MSELPGMWDESDLRGGEADCAENLLIVRKLKEENAALKEENERLKAEKVQINGKLAGSRLAVSRLKARVAELTAPDVQGEPVAALLISEPEYTKQGWEPGDWDIEPNATTIEAFAKLAKPGAYQLYLAPQPAEQQSALAKYQPSGCVICTCDHETQCQWCADSGEVEHSITVQESDSDRRGKLT